MGRTVEGGIKEHQDLERFTISSSKSPAKDQIDLMARCWFSLTPGRKEPIQHEYVDAKTGQTETIRITGSPEYGIATVFDQDLLIYVISQWIDAKRMGLAASRRVHFTPYQFLSWMNRETGGGQYQRLKEALNRLRTTTIETTVRSGNNRKNRIRQFSWISEWEITEEAGEIRGVEVVLAEWLFESIQDFHVLTLDKQYFDIPGCLERWLYLYARKATGGANGVWRESFKSLYQKSASQGEFKHFASSLRKLTKKNELPGLRLAHQLSVKGKPMLVMERTQKREAVEVKRGQQPELIERTPLEDAWETVLEILRKNFGTATVNSWMIPLSLIDYQDGTLTYRARNKFIAGWVESHYGTRMKEIWKSVGYEVKAIRIEAAKLNGTSGHKPK